MDLLEDLEFRGLLFQVTDRDELEAKLKQESISVYVGFDPTADSLHIGSLLPILALRRFQLAGHKPIALVGGATGLIGDPSGKKQERTLNSQDTVIQWTQRIREQLSRFIDFAAEHNPGMVVNNYDWTRELGVIDFLRDIGKHFSVNTMLNRESVSARLETGISFTEFSYMLLQANDFLQLFQRHGCTLQIGGSDQWGNIVGGIDLIRRVAGAQAYGLTLPLVTKADGTKFGKTESGAIWLDASKTSVYQFYQFWLNTSDDDVVRFLKYFTFLSKEEILALEQEVQTNPGARKAQKTLAAHVTELVHGAEATARAMHLSNVLFSGDIQGLTEAEIQDVFEGVPFAEVSVDHPKDIVSVLIASGACPSKRQAREDVTNGAIHVNGEKIDNVAHVFSFEQMIGGKYLVIRRGKKKYFLLKFV
ncbi:tyrosine--tRNA ligase [Alicyclobacillus cycloheptanicus]|uniref:Tyrosine--tRNA ligase n=1 Tax=Alicyclobacillus cycloheptanicus TaxID=1457 RepID=A0ABT9XI56_9BACL|nr:tyrosine--tRNA ligase [Alicyclobacillus cycloheptanicus]MDQ0189999.1 tyrosyl-tRNA synthetase [Alicyclobacillus cycloheptanicus]WDM00092.1 tyrosine--tRNA ligase [Alicyclobacillus cycloheptanicus]